jgi:hypothetical protein
LFRTVRAHLRQVRCIGADECQTRLGVGKDGPAGPDLEHQVSRGADAHRGAVSEPSTRRSASLPVRIG